MSCFLPANILLPRGIDLETWAVIACDQFSSEPEYWQRVRSRVGEAPSALHLIFPEAELRNEPESRIAAIQACMTAYERRGLFQCLENSFVYVERTLSDGTIRRGLVGMLDLERYDYNAETNAAVRATERTVVERIPPRVKIREGASLELPHALLLCDDEEDVILRPLEREHTEPLYDFELMEGGGHVRGWHIHGSEAEAACARIKAYEHDTALRYTDLGRNPMLYAVGDGNHSLATAKACYEKLRQTLGSEAAALHPARFAMVELENLHDDAQRFEPIHRIVTKTDAHALLKAARREIGSPDGGIELRWFSAGETGTLRLDPERGGLAVGVLQIFLDVWLKDHPGEIDYIHGEESLRKLSHEKSSIGFLLPEVKKNAFFRSIMTDGVLPRKTFSMGNARDKRYYLEARRIL